MSEHSIIIIVICASFTAVFVFYFLTVKFLVSRIENKLPENILHSSFAPPSPSATAEDPSETPETEAMTEKKDIPKMSDAEIQKELHFIEGRTALPVKTEGIIARKQKLTIELKKREKLNN